MSNDQIAFFIGLFGSVHCIGMCGPLAFAIPATGGNWWRMFFDKITYNLGRVISYTLLGTLIGFVGKQLWLSGLQQGVSFISGLLVIMAGLSRLLKMRLANNAVPTRLFQPINKLLNYALQHRAGHFITGMINGFLPCGFVYIALVGAVNTSTPVNAARYMFWFGMGTFPLMLLAMLSIGSVSRAIRNKINKAIPYFMICLGFWFVVRSIGINIPYLSPDKQTWQISTCH